MDYEKLHKDTIAKLQEMVNSGKITVKTACGICADFVPESEDERIRKYLFRIIEGQHSSYFPTPEGLSREQILAWLEKQPSNADNANKEYWRGYREGKQEILDKYAEFEKQGEKKSVDEIAKEVCKNKELAMAFLKSAGIMNEKGELAEQYRQSEQKSIDDLTQQEAMDIAVAKCFEQGEQKPAEWSKEDEAHIDSLLKRLEGICKPGAAFISTRFAISEDKDWLKSLKGRVQPQPKQEWSEEDERIYQSIMDDTVQKNQLDGKQTDWLRDIKYRHFSKSQNRWKPSDEQMHYLSWIANVNLGDSLVEQEVSKHLNELLEDLKKLRSE